MTFVRSRREVMAAMTVVQNVARRPGGTPYKRLRVKVTLVTGRSAVAGYTTDGDIISPGYVETDDDGAWSIDLVPNSQITPANTYYRVVEATTVTTIVVPATGGPYELIDVLSTPPPTPSAPGLTGVKVSVGGTQKGKRGGINLVAGTNVTISGADNPDQDRVDVTIDATGGGGGGGGTGSVNSVNGRTPDESGDVTLTAANVGADVAGAAAAAQTAAISAAEADAATKYLPLAAASSFDAAGAAATAQTNAVTAAEADAATKYLPLSAASSFDAAGAAASAQAAAVTAAEANAASTYVPLSAEGAASGIATLDASGHLNAGQAAKLANRLTPTAVKTGAYTAQAGDLVPVDATAGNVAITLVSAPADGTVIAVKMIATASGHTTGVTCGGTDVYNKTGGATVATLTLTAQAILLQYSAASGIWYVVGDDLPLSQLDARYVAKSTPGTLTDAATIATDASLGSTWRVTLGGNRTLGNPTNAVDGQLLTWMIKQDGTGSRTITLDTKFRFGTDITSITLTTTPGKTDHLGARYNAVDDKFDVVAFVRGF